MKKEIREDDFLGVEYMDDCTVKLWPGGVVSVDYGNVGKRINVFDEQSENPQVGGYTPREPNKVELIASYLYTLCEIQKCGHDVHKEIDEALKLYRKEAGF